MEMPLFPFLMVLAMEEVGEEGDGGQHQRIDGLLFLSPMTVVGVGGEIL